MHQLVAAPLADDYTARFRELTIGDPLDPGPDIGAMITQNHKELVMRYTASGQTEGAEMQIARDAFLALSLA